HLLLNAVPLPLSPVHPRRHHERAASRLDIRRWYFSWRSLLMPASASVSSGVTVSSSSGRRIVGPRRTNSAYVTTIFGSFAISARYSSRFSRARSRRPAHAEHGGPPRP